MASRTARLIVLGWSLGTAACAAPANPTAPAAPPSDAPPPSPAAREAETRKARGDALVQLANEDLAQGRPAVAKRRALAALEEDPASADAHAVLGAVHWHAGDVEASTRAFERALELDPRHFGASLGRARNLQARGKHREAAAVQDALLAHAPEQVDPLLVQMWSAYALADAARGVAVVDRIFAVLPKDDPQLPAVQAVAEFFRALASRGPLLTLDGEVGRMDAGLHHDFAIKATSAILGDAFARVVVAEGREEALVDPALVQTLGLRPVAHFVPLGGTETQALVIVPEVRFGELALRNVPALVADLSGFASAIGEAPGLVLGRQALQAFGSYTFDFPARTFVARRSAELPTDGIAVPLLMLSMRVLHAPAIPVRIDGSERSMYVYFGGYERSSIALTRRAYLLSGHLPHELEPLDDVARGLKMVYLQDVVLGDASVGGAGGLVMTSEPPDATLDLFRRNTGFELAGYLNTRMMEGWAVTYALGEGTVHIRTTPAQ